MKSSGSPKAKEKEDDENRHSEVMETDPIQPTLTNHDAEFKVEPLLDITNMPIVIENHPEYPLYNDTTSTGLQRKGNNSYFEYYEPNIENDPNNRHIQYNEEDQEQDEEENTATNQLQGRPKKGRKCKHPQQTRHSRKILKNSNQSYINQKGQLVGSKTFTDYHCKCNCNTKVSIESRKFEFNKFWELGHYEAQNAYLCAHIKQEEIKRKRNKESEKRKYTRRYSICEKVVCRNMFVNNFKISTKRINTALCKMRSETLKDKRGSHGGYNALQKDSMARININVFHN